MRTSQFVKAVRRQQALFLLQLAKDTRHDFTGCIREEKQTNKLGNPMDCYYSDGRRSIFRMITVPKGFYSKNLFYFEGSFFKKRMCRMVISSYHYPNLGIITHMDRNLCNILPSG